MTNAPKLSGSVGFEQPVSTPSQAPSGISTFANLGSGFLNAYARGQTKPEKPTAKEVEGDVLRPFAKRLEQLKNSDLDDAGFQRQARLELRSFYVNFPQHGDAARGLFEEGYGGTGETLEATPQDTFTEGFNTWMGETDGQSAMLEAGTLYPDDAESQNNYLKTSYAEKIREDSALEQSARNLQLVSDDLETFKKTSERDIVPHTEFYIQSNQKLRDGLVSAVLQGSEALDSADEITLHLRRQIEMSKNTVQQKLTGSGFLPEHVTKAAAEAVAPLQSLLDMQLAMSNDQVTLFNGLSAAAKAEQLTRMLNAFGPNAGNSDFVKATMEKIVNSMTAEDIEDQLSSTELKSRAGIPLITPVLVPTPTKEGDGLLGSDAQIKLQAAAVADPSIIPRELNTSITTITNSKAVPSTVLSALGDFNVMADVNEKPLSTAWLDKFFAPTSFNNVVASMQGNSKEALDIRNQTEYFITKQILRNKSVLQSLLEGRSLLSVQQDPETGVITLYKEGRFEGDPTEGVRRTVEVGPHPLKKGTREALFAVENLNRLNQGLKRLPELNVAPEVTENTFAGEQAPQGTYQIPAAVREDTEFLQAVSNLGADLGTDPANLLRTMAFETGGTFDPAQKNAGGSSATGLIQFMRDTAPEFGTTVEELAGMTRVEQMKYVSAYFKKKLRGVENPDFGDLYMAVLWPAAVGKEDTYVLWKEGSSQYKANAGLDSNGDGTITKIEASSRAFGRTGVMSIPFPKGKTSAPEESLRPQAREELGGLTSSLRPVARGEATGGGAETLTGVIPDEGTPTQATSTQREAAETVTKNRETLLADQTTRLLKILGIDVNAETTEEDAERAIREYLNSVKD